MRLMAGRGVRVAVLVAALAIGAVSLATGGASARAMATTSQPPRWTNQPTVWSIYPTVGTTQSPTAGTTEPSGGTTKPPPHQPPLTDARLARDLREARLITEAPADLTPSLTDRSDWGPLIVRNGCQLSLIHLVRSKPCVYGDPKAPTTVVLFGDSHAGMWFPALERISEQWHWRLLIFTKAGCSPPEVRLYRKCNTWRKNTEAQIAALHPALVVVSWARWIEPKARPEAGVATGYGSVWLDGMAAIFQFLQRSAGRVIFISDGPTFDFGAAACVTEHLTDVQACNDTPRSKAIFMPKLRDAEFELAASMQIPTIDPVPWFCTPTVCPVLVGNILVYYDSSHMTPAWSSFIFPVLASSIASILENTPGPAVPHGS
jgi:hypothetical protein